MADSDLAAVWLTVKLATVVTLLFGLLAWIGADVALKIQFVVFGVLMAALVSFFAGG